MTGSHRLLLLAMERYQGFRVEGFAILEELKHLKMEFD
jgi:hypothetical protein